MNLNDMISIDLPSLQSITLGQYALWGIYDDDLSCSLVMRSNKELQIIIDLDLPNLTSINSRGDSFRYLCSLTLESIFEHQS